MFTGALYRIIHFCALGGGLRVAGLKDEFYREPVTTHPRTAIATRSAARPTKQFGLHHRTTSRAKPFANRLQGRRRFASCPEAVPVRRRRLHRRSGRQTPPLRDRRAVLRRLTRPGG